MRASHTSSKRNSARRHSQQTPVTLASPSQNTRAAKKRRRMNLQKQHSQEKQQQLSTHTEELGLTTRHLEPPSHLSILCNSDAEPELTLAPLQLKGSLAALEDTLMPDQSPDPGPLPSCECCMPFAPNHDTLFCRPSFETGHDDKDVVTTTIEELPDWHNMVSDLSYAVFDTLEDADAMDVDEEERDDKQPLLFQVPLEIRQHIYSFVLPAVSGRPYSRYGKDIGWVKGSCDLLRVSKQIYEEAISVLYSNTIIEFDVNYKGISSNFTQKTGVWNSPAPKSLPDAGVDCEMARVRQVVINVPDMLSLEDWQSLEKHQASVKENGAVGLRPHLEKLVDMLANQCEELRHVQVNLRDWDEDVFIALETLQPLKKLMTKSSSITVYKVGWEFWPVTNFELVKEWQEPARSRDVYKYDLKVNEEGNFAIAEVERASVAKIPVKNEEESDDL